jgi:hypothetical protein
MQNKIFVKIKTKQHPANYHVHRIMFVDEMGKVVWTLYADAVIFKTENQVFIVEIAENLIGAKFAKIAMMLYNDYAGRIELYN